MAAGTDIDTDLVDEQQALDDVVAHLDDDGWATSTPSPGWTVADQIGHLTFFDTTAALALRDTEAFVAHRAQLLAAFGDSAALEQSTLGRFRSMSPADLLAEWRARRAELAEASHGVVADARVEWYGPSMSKRSFLTARLMEVWAHGQDVVDAVGGERSATDRIRHIAQLGVITRGWSYRNRGLEVPADDVRVELVAPSGDVWTWGDAAAPAAVTGPALDFCLVVTQRRHLDDTAIVAAGDAARGWMDIAQAFAGPATDGPGARTAPAPRAPGGRP